MKKLGEGVGNGIEGHSEEDITMAWHELSRLGLPYRYGGRAMDGRFEFLIVHPLTGATITSGRGRTVIQAMAEAALAGKRMILENGRGILPTL
ncbi:hypothetical protein [Desulfuromonas sp. TF]|uniref:hypothetical protein n=1 Tax=Desulfuromonas sp. TF TaxID=1232410 RepID=UPI00040137DE|nr:hypothetical protein [Desulfuromonas sp. TF]